MMASTSSLLKSSPKLCMTSLNSCDQFWSVQKSWHIFAFFLTTITDDEMVPLPSLSNA